MNCPVCNVEIPQERVDYLVGLRYPEHDIFCVKHASNRLTKAVYSGEVGTSELIFCRRVFDDSVQNTLLDAEKFDEENNFIETPENSEEEEK